MAVTRGGSSRQGMVLAMVGMVRGMIPEGQRGVCDESLFVGDQDRLLLSRVCSDEALE